MQQLVGALQKAGYTVETTRSKHYCVNKDGGPKIFMPCTPSDSRGMHRVRAKLRKIGYDPRKGN
ncbi:MAG: hypothetical protein HOV97_05890 [Nonomuraea sp.]|nr:hypothetical protein [Nonomuraea sp.]